MKQTYYIGNFLFSKYILSLDNTHMCIMLFLDNTGLLVCLKKDSVKLVPSHKS